MRSGLAKHRGRRTLVPLAAAVLIAIGLWQAGSAGYIHAKAWLAQVLLARAWTATLAGEARVRPWPWADTWPIARLQVPALGVDRIVLAGASGRTLAFGPGHLAGTPLPGEKGTSVLAGHRDTHFAWIGDLRVPVVGRVSMDLITLDVTGASREAVRPGGFVDLIGPHHDVDDVAAAAGTIGYEILTALGSRYHRVVVGA